MCNNAEGLLSKVASFKIDENEEKMHCLRKFNNKVSHTRSLDIFFFLKEAIFQGQSYLYFMPLSTIFQLYRGSQFFL